MKVFWGILESACLWVYVSVSVQNTTFLSKCWRGYQVTFSDSSSYFITKAILKLIRIGLLS